MTTPDPGIMARVDQVHADASRFIDQMLTASVTELQRGMPIHDLFIRLGGSLTRHQRLGELDDAQTLILVLVAVARLARLHHAIEQLADELDRIATKYESEDSNPTDVSRGMVAAFRLAAGEARKLVDDHG